ncbi:MAG: hypothetical protein IIC71_05275 [Acidobacteria bacterium]|nr:hypothetical protein [Acidobacteriota bacterium]
MRDRTTSVLAEILPIEERAIEAVVARYQRVAPAVTRFARSLSGNPDLQVRLGSLSSGGPDEIVLDPAVFQAAYARHAPVTPTEVALTSALHEVVHLIATNFEEKRPIPESWITPDSPTVAEHLYDEDEEELQLNIALFDFEDEDVEIGALVADVLDTDIAPTPGDVSLTQKVVEVSLVDALHEAAGMVGEALFLSLEDARQEFQFFDAFEGARSVLRDLYRSAAPEALANARPLGQYALGCFLIVGGYLTRDEVARRAAPHVAAALDDAQPFLDEVRGAQDPWAVGGIALQILQVAKLHRLVQEDGRSDSITTRKLKEEVDVNAISDTVDAVRIVTPPLASMESYEETRQAQTVSAKDGRKGASDQAGDPASDQLVRVSEAPSVYLPTGQSGKLVMTEFPHRFTAFAAEGHIKLAQAAQQWGVAQRRMSGELYPLFLANQRRGLRSGYDAGDLSPYAALLLGAGLYQRMFERRDRPTRRSYAVSLLIDGSASMLQPSRNSPLAQAPWALAAATLGAWSLAELCDELQIEFEVAIFNRAFAAMPDDSEATFSDRRHAATGGLKRSYGSNADRLTRTVNHYLLKSFDQRWRTAKDTVAGLFWMASAPSAAAQQARLDRAAAPPISMFDKAANVDEFNVAFAAQRLAGRRTSTRILVVLADGMTRGSVQALAETVAMTEHNGTTVLGIGIGDNTVEAAYGRHEVVEKPTELTAAIINGVRSTLHTTLNHLGVSRKWSITPVINYASNKRNTA